MIKTGIKSKLASNDKAFDQKKYESADKILHNEVCAFRLNDLQFIIKLRESL